MNYVVERYAEMHYMPYPSGDEPEQDALRAVMWVLAPILVAVKPGEPYSALPFEESARRMQELAVREGL